MGNGAVRSQSQRVRWRSRLTDLFMRAEAREFSVDTKLAVNDVLGK